MANREAVDQLLFPPPHRRNAGLRVGQDAPPVASPDVERHGDDLVFTWSTLTVRIIVDHLHETSGGVEAEITIGDLHWSRLNLASTSQREALVRKLSRIERDTDWGTILEQVCTITASRFRAGEPVVLLRPVEHPQRDLIAKMLPEGDPTVLFAPPSAGKGWMALTTALSLRTGKTLPGGLEPRRQVNSLYLDWEWSQAAHERRLARLVAGFGLHQVDGIFYRRMTRPLADEAAFLRREIAQRTVGFVVIDSYFLAAGPESYSPDAAGRLFAALRALGPVTSLVLTHTSWEQTERTSGRGRPIGTIQVEGQTRSEWELRRTEHDEGDTLTVGLYHRKVNDGRLHAPIGMRFVFGPGVVRIENVDIAETSDLLARTSMTYQLRQLLRSGAQTVSALAEATGSSEDTVGRTLRRLREEGKVVELPERQGREKLWGLAQ